MPTGNVPVLSGARILLTARRRGDDLGAALEERGAVGARAPTDRLGGGEPPAAATTDPRRCCARPPDVVVVTTATGLERWLAAAAARRASTRRVLRLLREARVVARGPKTRAALEAVGVVPDWLGEAETSAEITDFLLAEGVDGARVVLVARRAARRGR